MNTLARRFVEYESSTKHEEEEEEEEEGISMEIFSSNPKSFKIHRSSPLASSKLKPAISAKLLHFLPELTDDVFAEYITVLVCNGKNQYQAREDLDAFLGERTEDFVSWLWGHLLNCTRKWVTQSSLKNHDGSFTSPRNSDRDGDRTTRRTDLMDGLLACRKDISNKVSSREEMPRMILPKTNQGVPGTRKSKQICDRKVLRPVKEISCFSTRYTALKIPPSVSDHPSSKQDRRSTPPSLETKLSTPIGRPRLSVWDRLGKPFNDISNKKQDEEVHNQRASKAFGLDCVASWINKASLDLNKCVTSEKLQNLVAETFDPDPASNIQGKSLFEEVSGSPNDGSDPSKNKRTLVSRAGEICQELKKSKLENNDLGTPRFTSEMLEMKQRLHNMEMEMSKLRSKQVKIEKDRKPCQMSNSNPSELKHPEEDIDSRTIFVTNVHFAATNEALSSFFAKTGIVVNVVKMTDAITAKPNGSAYVTFAIKDSVERALALSGTTFLSRIVKVSRKEEANTPTQLAQKPSRPLTPSSHMNCVDGKPYNHSAPRLQWRRDNATAPSGPSASGKLSSFSDSA